MIIRRKSVYKNPNNPIAQYKINHPKLGWKFIMDTTGLSMSYLLTLSAMHKDEVDKVSVGVYRVLKERLAIDLLTKDNY